jgi:mevalonate kinase
MSIGEAVNRALKGDVETLFQQLKLNHECLTMLGDRARDPDVKLLVSAVADLTAVVGAYICKKEGKE